VRRQQRSFAECLERAQGHYDADLDGARAERDLQDDVAFAKRAELARVAHEYAQLFNSCPIEDIDRLIADACVDPYWDERTNLLSLLADEPQDLGLVLTTGAHQYAVVRQAGGMWIVDRAAVDWEALEDRAFAPYDDNGSAR
jgi:hypothetical protein